MEMYGKRNHAETAFGMIQICFGDRIRCRTEIGRKNEMHSKINAHNVRMLAKVIHELTDWFTVKADVMPYNMS